MRSRPAIFTGLIAVAGLCLSQNGQAQPENVREECRIEMAGAYLTAYDRKERARHYHSLVKRNFDQLVQGEAKLSRELDELIKRSAEGGLDLKLSSDRNSMAARLDSVRTSLAQSKEVTTEAAADVDRTLARERELRQMLKPVFSIERLADRPDGGYPLRIDYRHQCPRFRSLCKLPAAQAQALAAMRLGDQGLPLPCQRYVGQAGIAH